MTELKNDFYEVNKDVLEKAHFAAVMLSEKAGLHALNKLESSFSTSLKEDAGDLVTEVDLQCENIITSALADFFPDHSVLAEEGTNTFSSLESPWKWVVDPLDGTNNYAYGTALFSNAICLTYQDYPVVSAIFDVGSKKAVSSVFSRGIFFKGTSLKKIEALNPNNLHAASWFGYSVDSHEKFVQQFLILLRVSSRRVFHSWAPAVDTLLFLKGGIDLIVIYKAFGMEMPACFSILQEAGAYFSTLSSVNSDISQIHDFLLVGEKQAVLTFKSKLQTSLNI